jgi:hypothetical protein
VAQQTTEDTYKQRARTGNGVSSQTPRRSRERDIRELKRVTRAAKLHYEAQKERELKESDNIMRGPTWLTPWIGSAGAREHCPFESPSVSCFGGERHTTQAKGRKQAVSMQWHEEGNRCVRVDRCFPFGRTDDESAVRRRAKETLLVVTRAAETLQSSNGHYAGDVRLKALDKGE